MATDGGSHFNTSGINYASGGAAMLDETVSFVDRCSFHYRSEWDFFERDFSNLTLPLKLWEPNRLTWFMVVLSLQPLHHYPAWLPTLRAGRLGLLRCGIAEPSGQPAPLGQKTKYEDGFFEKAFMMLFARKMEKFASPVKKKKGWFDYDYEGFVDVSKRVMQGRSRVQQQEVVREVLLSMLPPGAPAQFRKLFPPTKWAAEFNAALTVPFFHWLVGPSEVVEVEIDGVKQKSGVRIKKCRYLENSGCVGMCVNMCKIPTQDFFTNEFGLPLTMIPNFEDMSCDMVYGQVPPPFVEDPVAKQPCYADICSMANPTAEACPTLQA